MNIIIIDTAELARFLLNVLQNYILYSLTRVWVVANSQKPSIESQNRLIKNLKNENLIDTEIERFKIKLNRNVFSIIKQKQNQNW